MRACSIAKRASAATFCVCVAEKRAVWRPFLGRNLMMARLGHAQGGSLGHVGG